MAALDILPISDPAWREQYEQTLPQAHSLAEALPLVRVFIPTAEPRLSAELNDVLREGWLRRDHQSPLNRKKEIELEIPHSLYFHGGRTHPDYGQAVIVIGNLGADVEVTPFGIGALCCPGHGRHHDEGQCLAPVCHSPVAEQRSFVNASTWRLDWRDRAAAFLAAYFAPTFADYFLPGSAGKPRRPDPDEVFTTPNNSDWRSWTIEIRSLNDIDVKAVIESGGLQLWALDVQVEDLIDEIVQNTGIPKGDLYPLLKILPEDRRVRTTLGGGSKSLFAVVDDRIQDTLTI